MATKKTRTPLAPLISHPPPPGFSASRAKHLDATSGNNEDQNLWGSVEQIQVRAADSRSNRADFYRLRGFGGIKMLYVHGQYVLLSRWLRTEEGSNERLFSWYVRLPSHMLPASE